MKNKMVNRKLSIILFVIQCLLGLGVLLLGVLYLFGHKNLLDTVEIILGADLVVTGVNNYLVHRNIQTTMIYLAVGLIILGVVLLNVFGVL